MGPKSCGFCFFPSCRFRVHVSQVQGALVSQGMQVEGSALGRRTGIYLVSMLGLSISISSVKAQKEARQNRKNKDTSQRDQVQTESYTS